MSVASRRVSAWVGGMVCAAIALACHEEPDGSASRAVSEEETPTVVNGPSGAATAPADDSDPHMARERASTGGDEAEAPTTGAAQRRGAMGRAGMMGGMRRSGSSGGGGGAGARHAGGGGSRYGIRGPAATPSEPDPLPQNGVLANNFVGGTGVTARLEQLLDRGVMIDGERVKLEAFQDRRPLPYPAPKDDAVALFAETERAKMDADGDTMHMQIALVGRQGEAPPRPRLDVRLVLDRSGSMSSERKWSHAVEAAEQLVGELRPSDTFGLITYADEASLDIPPQRVRSGRTIRETLSGLHPGGSTNIEAALSMAEAHAPKRRSPSDVGLVVLLSDGMATVGVRDPRALGKKARAMFDDAGVLTTAVGLGTSFDEETMLTVAREGSGSYHFVRRAEDIPDVLQDELHERVQAVAQALRVRVELGPGVVAKRVYGSRLLDEKEHAAVRRTEKSTDRRVARELGIDTDRDEEPETGLRIHLPTFRRGDQHAILMQLEVPGGRAGSTAGVARVHLDYKDLLREKNGDAEVPVRAERVAERSEAMTSVRRTVKRTVLAFRAGEALQKAADALGSGNPQSAAKTLSERREVLEAGAEMWRDDTLRRDAALLRRYEKVVSRAWDGFGADDRRTLAMAMRWYGDERMQ